MAPPRLRLHKITRHHRRYKLEERKQEERLADAKMNKKAELKKRHDKGKKHGSSAKPRSQKRK